MMPKKGVGEELDPVFAKNLQTVLLGGKENTSWCMKLSLISGVDMYCTGEVYVGSFHQFCPAMPAHALGDSIPHYSKGPSRAFGNRRKHQKGGSGMLSAH